MSLSIKCTLIDIYFVCWRIKESDFTLRKSLSPSNAKRETISSPRRWSLGLVELILNAALVCKRSSVRWFLLEKEGYFPTHFDYPLVLFSKVCVKYIESFDLLYATSRVG